MKIDDLYPDDRTELETMIDATLEMVLAGKMTAEVMFELLLVKRDALMSRYYDAGRHYLRFPSKSNRKA